MNFMLSVFNRWQKKLCKRSMLPGIFQSLVGGTGFYIQALLYDIDFTDNDNDTSLRAELETFAEEHGAEALA